MNADAVAFSKQLLKKSLLRLLYTNMPWLFDWEKEKTLWPLFMDGVQLPQG